MMIKIFLAILKNGKREFDPRITHSPLPMIEFLVTTIGNGRNQRNKSLLDLYFFNKNQKNDRLAILPNVIFYNN